MRKRRLSRSTLKAFQKNKALRVSAAEKLRKRMQGSKDGWTANQLRRLYLGYGFQLREGSKHRVFSHPTYPYLRATTIRDGVVAVGYIETALELLEKLEAAEKGETA